MASPIAAQGGAAAAQATDSQRLRAGGPDGRPFDGAQHAVRRHANRRHESGCRRCNRRSASRSADRRQERRNGEPDRVGRRPAPSVRRRGRSRRDDAPADLPEALSGRRHSGCDERREHHPDGQRVEQRRHAARGRDRRRDVEQDQRRQPAAAARRLGEPAGDAAGPHRRGQPQGHPGARRQLLHEPARCGGPRDDAAVRGARLRRREGGRPASSAIS